MPHDDQATMLAGVAETDITPPMGVEMCGYGPYLKRQCREVADPLFARALWLQSGETHCVLITADLTTMTLAMREQVIGALKAASGSSDLSVMIAVSHTHYAPPVAKLIAWGERDEPYLQDLTQRLINVALAAQKDLQPAHIAAARQRISEIGINREQPDLGPIDTAAQLMRIDTPNGKTLATVVNFGAHPVINYPFGYQVSADWPGALCREMAKAFDGAPCLFLQGSLGNINGLNPSFVRDDRERRATESYKRAEHTGTRLFEQVLPAVRSMQPKATTQLRSINREIQFPFNRPKREALIELIEKHTEVYSQMTLADVTPLYDCLEDEPQSQYEWRDAAFRTDAARHQLEILDSGRESEPALLQAMQIDEALIIGWPAEVYVELGLELRQRSPVPLTFVVNFANHCVGYIPTYGAYESQGQPNRYGAYPTTTTPRLYGTLAFQPDVGEQLVEETLKMIRELIATH